MACSIHVKPGMYAKKNMQLQMKNALTVLHSLFRSVGRRYNSIQIL